MTDIISRKKAKDLGLKTYFTGKPCPRGHIAERYVSICKCLMCNVEYAREHYEEYYDPEKKHDYYELHKDTILSANAQWALDHPEEVKDIHKNWRDNNKEKLRELGKQRRTDYPEKERERVAEWRRNNPAKYRQQKYRRRMLEALAQGSFTEADLIALLEQQNGICNGPVCEKEIVDTFTVDHRMPLSRGGNNDPDNLQLLCTSCNSSKGTRTDDEWRNSS